MSKKNRRNAKTTIPAETAPVQETAVALETAPVQETVAPAETTETPAPATEAPAVAAGPRFQVNAKREFKPRKGFETVLYAALQEPRSEAEVLKHLLESGDYQRVAPKAAEMRAAKPVRYLLKVWTQGRVLTVAA